MNTQKNQSKNLRRVFTLALLVAVVVQLFTVINILTGFIGIDTGTIHIVTGLTIFALIIIHFIFFRKTFFFLFK